MNLEHVRYEREGGIATFTLDRPERLNALTFDSYRELTDAFCALRDDDELRCVVITGTGRAFCSGADVKELFDAPSARERDIGWSMGRNPEGFLGRSINWKPVIAAVHGHCLAWGLAIAVECDLVVASEEVQFGLTETLRSFPGGPVWAKLQFFMPSKIATEMLLTGQPVSASELYRLGLINRIVPKGEHVQAAQELAEGHRA